MALLSAGTLSGGTWTVGAGSTLSLSSGTITTNAATIILGGSGASFPALAPLATNAAAGVFDLANGQEWNEGAGDRGSTISQRRMNQLQFAARDVGEFFEFRDQVSKRFSGAIAGQSVSVRGSLWTFPRKCKPGRVAS